MWLSVAVGVKVGSTVKLGVWVGGEGSRVAVGCVLTIGVVEGAVIGGGEPVGFTDPDDVGDGVGFGVGEGDMVEVGLVVGGAVGCAVGLGVAAVPVVTVIAGLGE